MGLLYILRVRSRLRERFLVHVGVLQDMDFHRVSLLARSERPADHLLPRLAVGGGLQNQVGVVVLEIPALRERKEDIIALASHFVRKYRKAFNRQVDHLPNSIVDMLLMHSWPGNVRDLENVIQRAVLLAKDNVISESDILFDAAVDSANGQSDGDVSQLIASEERNGLKAMLAKVEKQIIATILKRLHGNVQEAAKNLQVGKTALYDKVKRYGINPKSMKH